MMKETSTIKKLLDISISIYLSLVVSNEKSQNGYKQNFIGKRMKDVSNESREPIL